MKWFELFQLVHEVAWCFLCCFCHLEGRCGGFGAYDVGDLTDTITQNSD